MRSGRSTKTSGSNPPSLRLALDTSAYSRFRSGHPVLVEWLARSETIELSATALGELQAGFLLGRRYRENRLLLDEFLDEPYVSIAPVTHETARRYGEIFANLRRAGTPIPTNDIWIAASALETGAHLVTFDEDFEAIGGLPCTCLPS